jgi:hypothetical protein
VELVSRVGYVVEVHRTAVLLALGCLAFTCKGRASRPAAPTVANTAPADASVVPLPKEPWYADKDDRTDDCVAALPAVPARHFPAPFATCDPREVSYASPPGSPHLHFHYRFFSVALTETHRRAAPDTCCYMVWRFPR